MLRLRPKLGSDRNNEWRCCFCLHVRTGTILLGTWHLMLHLVALGFLAAIVRDPRLLEELERDSAPADWGELGAAMPTPLSNVESPPSPFPQHGNQPRDYSLIYNDVDLGALVTLCTLVITLFLIYGASRGKPVHLLPFFCLQIFDFAITVMTATGYLCHLRSIHHLIAETKRVPWRAQLLQLSTPTLTLIVLGAILLAILIKLYCLRVVWRCFKYLSMLSIPALSPFVISSEAASPGPVPYAPAPYSSLLPDYEEAVKQTPPPSYRAATLMAVIDPNVVTAEVSAAPAPAPAAAAPAPAAAAPPQQSTDTVVMLPQQGAHVRV
ncbi:PREDICTED: tetraspanning orphan receptor [Papilio polytes]|uniref:tetraspanning orphan receptor n=1 Tax=Papilio polytes TaxID=76194 RepID=UPI000676AEEA|nr:PREDICTED: tetraspanning orphan receptor [Papilio polytes]XP_013145362.1 PREDICTED: tetraspanning orphan receptor [Papilio polytes]